MTSQPRPAEAFLGFPSGVLGPTACRLRVLYRGDGFLAIEKPLGCWVDANPAYEGIPSLVGAIRTECSKPSFQQLGVQEKVKAVYNLEPEVTGIAIVVTEESQLDKLRNAYGSYLWRFRFRFLALDSGDGSNERECLLPVANRKGEPRSFISNKLGKQAKTCMRRLESHGDYSWWEAEVDYMRLHQVRLHAQEVGLSIVGDSLYGSVGPLFLSDLKKKGFKKRAGELPLYSGVYLHLCEVSASYWKIEAPLPQGMQVLHRQLLRWS